MSAHVCTCNSAYREYKCIDLFDFNVILHDAKKAATTVMKQQTWKPKFLLDHPFKTGSDQFGVQKTCSRTREIAFHVF